MTFNSFKEFENKSRSNKFKTKILIYHFGRFATVEMDQHSK